jgi:Zn-dependent M28 family amino/carboxypeptidase
VDVGILSFGIWTTTILISFSNIVLMLLNTNNKSPGALDNASGMAIVFELSSYFKDHPLNNFNLWFCQFSAEELGTMGSRIFVSNRENQFARGFVFQINSDMVSSATFGKNKNKVQYLKSYGVFPRRTIAPLLNAYLHEAARLENLHIDGFHVSTGAHTDTVPFHLRKDFCAVDITTRAAAKWTHNEDDTPDKVDPQVLRDACVIIRRTVLLLDKDYNVLCESQKSAQMEK